MAGNVAEWCQDDFSPVYNPLVWDLNPVFLYDAEKDQDSPHLMKKVVRGGMERYCLLSSNRNKNFRV